MKNKLMKPVERLTVSTLGTIYGCCGLFDLCGQDDLISLTMQGSSPFFDWLQWIGTNECVIERDFINWIRPEEASRAGWVSDPCGTPNTVEFGTANFKYEDFGRLRRGAPVTDITKAAMKLCNRQPRYRLDGTRVDNDLEFRALLTAEGISQDLHSLAVIGNNSTAGQFDGLQQIVKGGYTTAAGKRVYSMDSIVVDMNHNTVAGGAGVTWTDGRGARAVPATADLIDILRDIYRVIRQRIKMAPVLAAQQPRVGDAIILCTTEMTEAIKDLFTYWSVYPGAQYYEASFNSLEGRDFREKLNGGMFGDGFIDLHGFQVPLLGYDWELQNGPTSSDIYFLMRGVGNVRTFTGEYNNFESVTDYDKFMLTDGNRFLHWFEDDETCVSQRLEFQPRMLNYAPWTCARITNVVLRSPGGVLSADPMQSSFFPESSFVLASC